MRKVKCHGKYDLEEYTIEDKNGQGWQLQRTKGLTPSKDETFRLGKVEVRPNLENEDETDKEERQSLFKLLCPLIF